MERAKRVIHEKDLAQIFSDESSHTANSDIMSARHFFHDPLHLVQHSLSSLPLTNPSLSFDASNKIVFRTPLASNGPPCVSLVSGGGSGHEPSFAGFVGDGMLTASVAGTIFASPSAEQVRRCIMARVPGERGVCVVVMNYTGDVLNFGMAVEKAKAAGLDVDMVIVGDDVGVGREKGGKVGRRGIAGTVLVLKIAGALARTGAPLKDVVKIAQLTADNVVSVGASLAHVHVPGRGPMDEDIKEGEVEVGMGIHNEPGSEKIQANLETLVGRMLAQMLDQSDKDRSFLSVKDEDTTVLLINNLGGLSVLELGGVTSEVKKQLLETYGIDPARIVSGTLMTSLNGVGFSISLLRLQPTGLGHGKEMLDLLDSPAETSGWTLSIHPGHWGLEKKEVGDEKPREETTSSNFQSKRTKLLIGAPLTPRLPWVQRESPWTRVGANLVDFKLAKKALTAGLEKVIAAEPDITRFDTVVGDGDCGIGMKRGAEAIIQALDEMSSTSDPLALLGKIVEAVETVMDGTSGALYAIFLNSLLHRVYEQSGSTAKEITVDVWAKALGSAMTDLEKYTPARPGDRTLVDALKPFVDSLAKSGNIAEAADAAKRGAERTKGMVASLGRTVYVGGDGWKDVPDPGAYALSLILNGIADALG